MLKYIFTTVFVLLASNVFSREIELYRFIDALENEIVVTFTQEEYKEPIVWITFFKDEDITGSTPFDTADLSSLQLFFNEPKRKYIEWTKIAVENDVEKAREKINVFSPSFKFFYEKEDEEIETYCYPSASWIYIKNEGSFLYFFVQVPLFNSSKEEFDTVFFGISFPNLEEIEKFRQAISFENIKKYRQTKLFN